MRERKAYKKGNLLVSETVETADYSKEGGGKIKKITTLEMDRGEAERQLKWIEQELKKASGEYEQAKHNASPAGRMNLVHIEKQKMRTARLQQEEMENLKKEYERAIS